MPFEIIFRCTDCKMEFLAIPRTHNCSQNSKNKTARAAEHEAWEKRYNFVKAQWEAWLEKKGMADEPGCPSMDNLPTERAFEGRCVIFGFGWDNEFKMYRTGILVNPTWGRVFRMFLACMAITGDTHHSFLEGIKTVTERPKKLRNLPADVTVLKFSTGS